MSNAALMDAATEPGVGFAADLEGGYILPRFLPAFDAAATVVVLLDLLAVHQVALSEVVAGLPEVHMAHQTVVTPWEQKGVVMRSLVERSGERRLELVDGVKVFHDGSWVLAVPDTEEPVTHLWAESTTDGEARQLAEEYARRVEQMVR